MAARSSAQDDDFSPDEYSDEEATVSLSPTTQGKFVKRFENNVVMFHILSGKRGRPKVAFEFPPRPKKALTISERVTIVRVFSNLNRLGEQDAAQKTAALLNFSKITVQRIISEFSENEGELQKRRRGNFTSHPVTVSTSAELRDRILTLILERASRKENTSAKKMIKILTEEKVFPSGSVPTYRSFIRYLKRQKFKFGRDHKSKKISLDASITIKLKRAAYLDAIASPPSQNMIDVYQDESYCHANHNRNLTWFLDDDENTKREKKFKGNRFCFSACITEDGLC